MSDREPKLTFWSIPPFRQRLRTAARTIKAQQARSVIAAIYAFAYSQYGLKVPAIIWILWLEVFRNRPAAVDVAMAGSRFLLAAGIVCQIVSGIGAGLTAWFVLGRAIRSRRHSPVRFGIWGALALGAPLLLGVGIVPAEQMLFLLANMVLMLLFSAGIAVVLGLAA
ncbi:MAG: hypothetical protein ACT4QC_00315 [Planctomycetaceae bacterium]